MKAVEELVVLFPVENGLELLEFEVLLFKALLLLLPKVKAAVDFLASEDDVDACPNLKTGFVVEFSASCLRLFLLESSFFMGRRVFLISFTYEMPILEF